MEKGWPHADSSHFGVSPFDQLWELVLEGPQVNMGLIGLMAMWYDSAS